MALDEAVDAALEHLFGAAGDQQDPQACDGLVAQPLGECDQDSAGAEVVVGARHDPVAGDVGAQAEGGGREDRAHAGEPAPPRERAGQDGQRAGDDRPPDRQRGVGAGDEPGEPLRQPALEALVEGHAGRGRVVMGEDDERPVGLPVAGLGDDVPGRLGPLGHAPPDAAAVLDVVDHRRDACCSGEARRCSPAAARDGESGGYPDRAQRHQHLCVAVEEQLLVHHDRRSRALEHLGQHPCRALLAG